MDISFTAVGTSIGVAVLLSLWAYISKFQNGEKFDLLKITRTAFVGSVLGLIAGLFKYHLTVDNFASYLAANAGAIAFADSGVKVLMNKVGLNMPVVK